MLDTPANPFIYGRPVIGKEFFGREPELNAVISRVRNRESTAIVGEPHIGKTSFLMNLMDKQTLSDMLGEEHAKKIIPHFINLHDCPPSYTPQKFWQDALQPLSQDRTMKKLLGSTLDDMQSKRYDRQSVEKVFRSLSNAGYLFLLLLDEFDVLLEIKGFKSTNFFTGLRGLTSLSGGLSIITASRLTIMKMNERGRDILDVGSPFFNTLVEIRLKPFDDKTIEKLLSQVETTARAYQQIQRIAGRQPFVLQALAASFVHDPDITRASNECYKQIKSHFVDVWDQIDEAIRIPLIILCLNENKNKIGGNSFRVERVLKNRDKFLIAIRQLEDVGIIEKVTKTSSRKIEWDTFFNDNQETWAISSLLFMWWMCEVVQNPDGSIREFLRDRKINGFLTDLEVEKLVSGAQHVTNITRFMEQNSLLFEFLKALKP